MATKTFCDRCFNEAPVEEVSLEITGRNVDGAAYMEKSTARDLCRACAGAVKHTLFEKLAVAHGR